MSISIGSSSDALSYMQSLLQSVGNLAGSATGVGPIGDWLTNAASGDTQAAGGSATGAQTFGAAPSLFPDKTMSALISIQGQQDAGGASGDASQSGSAGGSDGLLDPTSADGSKTQTMTNADGSTTTTVTYADGSTVTTTTPAPTQASTSPGSGPAAQGGSSAGAAKLIEQLGKIQSQLVPPPGASMSALA